MNCACGKPAWVIVRGEPMCRECYYKDIDKAHWLDEQDEVTHEIRRCYE